MTETKEPQTAEVAVNGELEEDHKDMESRLSAETPQEVGSQLNGESALEEWGFPVKDLYRMAIKFYKENESKAFHPSYDSRNKLVALTLQAKYGPYVPDKGPPLGALDIVGRDRRQAWSDLASLSQEDSMGSFVRLLDELCSSFKPYIEAHKREKEERERKQRVEEEDKRKQQEEVTMEQQRLEEEAKRKAQEEIQRFEDQKRAIQEALNKQTYQQFASYAHQQYPNNREQQEVLVRQLQEQHYQQYTQQMLQHQLRSQQSGSHQRNPSDSEAHLLTGPSHPFYKSTDNAIEREQNGEQAEERAAIGGESADKSPEEEEEASHTSGSGDEIEGTGPVAQAQMWTRKEIVLFKDAIRKEGGDGIIKVGHGEIVTVRVPTHPDGTCIFWEFATDGYDIGFGLLFEWTKNPGNQVSVHISESEDDDEDEDDDEQVGSGSEPIARDDVEKGTLIGEDGKKEKGGDELPCSVIVPIFRRDCHEEVFAGSHPYPGRGVYLLKFDNSYSLWRSKTLYYRVYYTR